MPSLFNVRPLKIVVHAASARLAIDWADGVSAALGFSELRAACKCAHCEQARRSGKQCMVSAGIRLTAAEPFGESALRLSFDDGHDLGIYPFVYLHGLAKARSNLV